MVFVYHLLFFLKTGADGGKEIYMTNKLFIGNLEYSVTEAQLTELFATFGTVLSVKIIIDRMTNLGKGFAFVEMDTAENAAAAMAKLDGSSFAGRALVVKEAKPQERR